jgi:hypothetical protein
LIGVDGDVAATVAAVDEVPVEVEGIFFFCPLFLRGYDFFSSPSTAVAVSRGRGTGRGKEG